LSATVETAKDSIGATDFWLFMLHSVRAQLTPVLNLAGLTNISYDLVSKRANGSRRTNVIFAVLTVRAVFHVLVGQTSLLTTDTG
jgi:hypothetical protein